MKRVWKASCIKCAVVILFIVKILFINSIAYADLSRTKGQTVYLSVYPQFDRAKNMAPKYLFTTITIRNTDMKYPITVVSIKYYDSNGKLNKNALKNPLMINPLASISKRFKEMELKTGGGMAGCFIIMWKSEKIVNEPLIEGIMVGTGTGKTETLIFHGQVIEDDTK